VAREKEIKVKITGDSKSAEQAFENLKEKSHKLGTALKAGLVAAGAAVGAFAVEMKKAVQAAAEQEKAELTLAQAMKHHGTYTEAAFNSLREFASERQKLTKYSDELTLSNLRLLQTFGMDTETMKKAMVAAQDLASAKGIDLTTAVNLLGKAYAGNTTMMTRYGIVLDQNRLKTEGFTYVLEEMQKHFGGAAQAEADTYTGRLEQMKNAFGELQEVIGFAILPALKDMVSSLRDMFSALAESGTLEKVFKPLADAFSKLAPLIGETITTIIQTLTQSDIFSVLTEAIASIFEALLPVIQQVGPPLAKIAAILGDMLAQILSALAPVIETLAPIIAKIIEKVGEFLQKMGPTLQRVTEQIVNIIDKILIKIEPHLDKILDLGLRVLEAALKFLPPILTIAEPLIDLLMKAVDFLAPISEFMLKIQGMILGVLGKALEWLAGVVSNLGNIWSTVWEGIKAIAEAVWNALVAAWNAIIQPLITIATKIWDGVKAAWDAVWGAIGGALSATWNAISGTFSAIWSGVKGAVMRVWDGVKEAWERVWGGLKGVVKGAILGILKVVRALVHALDWAIPGGATGKVDEWIAKVESWHSGGWIRGTGEKLLPLGLFEGGEFVVPRKAAERLGPDILEVIRRGMVPVAPARSVVLNINVDTMYGDRAYVDLLANRILEALPRAQFRYWGR